MRGQITFYNIGKGFGFLALGPRSIFFHTRNFQSGFQPVVGRWVEFELGPGLPGKPPQAINVRYADGDKIDLQFQEIARRASLAGEGGDQ